MSYQSVHAACMTHKPNPTRKCKECMKGIQLLERPRVRPISKLTMIAVLNDGGMEGLAAFINLHVEKQLRCRGR